jgi:hypothetical protein
MERKSQVKSTGHRREGVDMAGAINEKSIFN